MAHMLDLPLDLLTTIITLMVMSSGDIEDLPRVTAVCKRIYSAAIQPKCLKLVKCVPQLGLFGLGQHQQHINGLLSRCVQAENPTADSVMAKVILYGGAPLWRKIQENVESVSRMKTLSTLQLSNLRMLAKSFRPDSIGDAPYIVFSLEEDEPSLYEPYKRLHPLRLIKSFITHASSYDIAGVYPCLQQFILFFVGYPEFMKSGGIGHVLEEMFQHEQKVWQYEYGLKRSAHISEATLNMTLPGFLAAETPKLRGQVITAIDKMIKL